MQLETPLNLKSHYRHINDDLPLVPQTKQGRSCANNIVLGNVQKYNGSINTAIVKCLILHSPLPAPHPNT